MWAVSTHLAVIAFHMIVFVHGYNSNGFIRALERNSHRQMQLRPILPEDSPLSCSVKPDKSFKRSIKKSVRTVMSAKSRILYPLNYSCASQPWGLRVCHPSFISYIVSEVLLYFQILLFTVLQQKKITHTQEPRNMTGLTEKPNWQT